MINDYELIENIASLFDNKNILYGAGFDGRRISRDLEDAGIRVECFCDKEKNGEVRGYKIIDPNTLCEKASDGKLNIIITSTRCHSDILNDINRLELKANIYTYWGVDRAIARNINDHRFQQGFAKKYLRRKELLLENRRYRAWLDYIYQIIDSVPEILVYQMGKVGSTSVYCTLRDYVNVMHIHSLDPDNCVTGLKSDFSEALDILKSHKLKIITMIREPISQVISNFFENAEKFMSKEKIEENVVCFLESSSVGGYPFKWFKSELEMFTGIDIYKYDFNRRGGYIMIKEGNYEILCLQMEKMSVNEKVIGDFCGIKDFHLKQANVGSDKVYNEVYRRVKDNLVIPQKIIDRYYVGNAEMDFFYSEEDKHKFLNRIHRTN